MNPISPRAINTISPSDPLSETESSPSSKLFNLIEQIKNGTYNLEVSHDKLPQPVEIKTPDDINNLILYISFAPVYHYKDDIEVVHKNSILPSKTEMENKSLLSTEGMSVESFLTTLQAQLKVCKNPVDCPILNIDRTTKDPSNGGKGSDEFSTDGVKKGEVDKRFLLEGTGLCENQKTKKIEAKSAPIITAFQLDKITANTAKIIIGMEEIVLNAILKDSEDVLFVSGKLENGTNKDTKSNINNLIHQFIKEKKTPSGDTFYAAQNKIYKDIAIKDENGAIVVADFSLTGIRYNSYGMIKDKAGVPLHTFIGIEGEFIFKDSREEIVIDNTKIYNNLGKRICRLSNSKWGVSMIPENAYVNAINGAQVTIRVLDQFEGIPNVGDGVISFFPSKMYPKS